MFEKIVEFEDSLQNKFLPTQPETLQSFDETRDSALECAKQNLEASSLTEREKKAAKECVDKAVHYIAQKFKSEMIHSGRIIKSESFA